MPPEAERERTARCTCGQLSLTLAGPPDRVYACGCRECQRATGSAFGWRARYGKSAVVRTTGEHRRFRRGSDAGRWVEQIFCPVCGTQLYMEAEVISDGLVVSAGCFEQADVGPPAALSNAGRRPDWLTLGEAIPLVE